MQPPSQPLGSERVFKNLVDLSFNLADVAFGEEEGDVEVDEGEGEEEEMYGSDDDGTDPRGEDVILTETDDEDVS